jgi:CheY-like chemotaxis protein
MFIHCFLLLLGNYLEIEDLKTHYDSSVTALVEFKPIFYDLLLIDVSMPLLDGFQLVQAFNPPKYDLAFSSIFASFSYCLIPSISLHSNKLITALPLYFFNMTEDDGCVSGKIRHTLV